VISAEVNGAPSSNALSTASKILSNGSIYVPVTAKIPVIPKSSGVTNTSST
jgi:hypothetical protein